MTDKPTAPGDIWNNYHTAKAKPDVYAMLRSQDITAERLCGWESLPPERQEHIRTLLAPHARH